MSIGKYENSFLSKKVATNKMGILFHKEAAVAGRQYGCIRVTLQGMLRM